MRIREISATVSRTFNLGNFESLKVEGGAVAELADGEDPVAARERMLAEIRETLTKAYLEFKPKKGGEP